MSRTSSAQHDLPDRSSSLQVCLLVRSLQLQSRPLARILTPDLHLRLRHCLPHHLASQLAPSRVGSGQGSLQVPGTSDRSEFACGQIFTSPASPGYLDLISPWTHWPRSTAQHMKKILHHLDHMKRTTAFGPFHQPPCSGFMYEGFALIWDLLLPRLDQKWICIVRGHTQHTEAASREEVVPVAGYFFPRVEGEIPYRVSGAIQAVELRVPPPFERLIGFCKTTPTFPLLFSSSG